MRPARALISIRESPEPSFARAYWGITTVICTPGAFQPMTWPM